MSRFSSQRGRPKRTELSHIDLGTAELIFKRAHRQTLEMLDDCLERGLITRAQHWCGIHLRWLYTLRYGAPSVRAMDVSDSGGFEHGSDDPQWRIARELEFNEAMQALRVSGHDKWLLAFCVFNEKPAFLTRNHKLPTELNHFREGLDLLESLWH